MMETFIISLGLIARFWQERSAQQDRELAIETQILDDISKEIHDDVLQNLSVINRNLEKLQPENNLSPEERLLNHRKIINKDEVILITKGLLTDVTKELRDLTNIWEPVKGKNMIEDIRKKCDVFNTVGAFLVTVSVEGEPTSMDFKKSVHITRIIQEALNNTLKHAKATEADVLLKFNTRHMEMRIRDNGSGFDPLRVRRGHGLQNIKDRCGKLNATCRYSTKEGTEIHIAVPL